MLQKVDKKRPTKEAKFEIVAEPEVKAKPKAKDAKPTRVTITPPNMARAVLRIVGTAPYMQNKFSSANREAMKLKQEMGSAAAKTRKAKAPKDFEAVYRSSMHLSQEGWHGIPANAFRQALIDACRLTEMDMTRAKMCLFPQGDGLDADTLEPLVKIEGKPRMQVDRVKIGQNQTDLAARAIFETWACSLQLEWDADVFSAQDVINLMQRAGMQIGIGAGRHFSKNSAGTGKGTFRIQN